MTRMVEKLILFFIEKGGIMNLILNNLKIKNDDLTQTHEIEKLTDTQ